MSIEDARAEKIEPLDYQCLLLERAHKLASIHASATYKHIVQLDTEGNTGGLMSRLQHGDRTEAIHEILQLCPDVYAMLVPFIKLSRVDYTPEGKPTGDEQPLHIPNFLSSTDVDSILAGELGRAPGSGIQSFTWSLEGVQPAEVDNNITADLVIYFQTVGDFFQQASQAGVPGKPNFLDLIINSPAIVKAENAPAPAPSSANKVCPDSAIAQNEYVPHNFRIKVCAGWATPPGLKDAFPLLQQKIPGSQKTRYEALVEGLKSTRTTLFLQAVRHYIDFKENGSMTLSIKYQASLSGITKSPHADIFAPGKNAQSIASLRDKKREEEAKGEEADQGKIDDLLEEIDELEKTDRKLKYQKLLSKLYASNKIYQIQIPVEDLIKVDLTKLDDDERIELARDRQQADFGTPGTTSTVSEDSLVMQLGSADTAEEAGESATESAAAHYKDLEGSGWFNNREDNEHVNYMYLGDLLDAVLDEIKENSTTGDIGFDFFLSEVEFIDMLVALQIKDSADLKRLGKCRDPADSSFLDSISDKNPSLAVATNLFPLINIGDIPISMDTFQAFFVRNVVNKQRNSYYFLNFIKDVCSQLISSALASKCYGSAVGFAQRFDAQPLSYRSQPKRSRITVSALAKARGQLTCEDTDATKFGMGAVLFSTDSAARGLKGEFMSDLKRGVYHHYIGAACGLMKKMSFKREDQPYLRESKIEKKGALGADQLRELYSVDIDLIGNNLYRNGQYIYVSPLLMNTTAQQMKYLGLHGYYLVTAVSCKITPQNFTTSIRALQESIQSYGTAGSGRESPQEPGPSDSWGALNSPQGGN